MPIICAECGQIIDPAMGCMDYGSFVVCMVCDVEKLREQAGETGPRRATAADAGD